MSTLWKWQEAVSGILMVVLGVVFLIMPGLKLTSEVIAQAAAAVMAAAGLIFIIVYFVRRRSSVVGYDLVKAAVLIAAGVYTYLNVKTVSAIIPVALGMIVLISGILLVQRSIDLRHFEGSAWILLLIAALLSIIAAVLTILNPFSSEIWLSRLISGGLIFTGVFLVISAFVVGHRVSRYTAERADRESDKDSIYDGYGQEQLFRPEKPVYTPEEPADDPQYSQSQITEENDIPEETDLPAESAGKGLRGLFKKNKS